MLLATPALILPPEKPAIIRQARPQIIRPGDPKFILGSGFPFPFPMIGAGGASSGFALTNLGTGSTISAGTGQINQVADIPVGSTVVALGVTNSSLNVVVAIDDDNGTYTQIGSTLTVAGLSVTMWYTFNSAGMSGSAFLGSFNSTPSAWGFSAFAISGALTTDPLDASTSNTSIAVGTISATLSTVAAKTLLVGGVGLVVGGGITQTGYSTPFNTGGSSAIACGGNKQLSVAGSNTYTANASGSTNMGLVLASFALQ